MQDRGRRFSLTRPFGRPRSGCFTLVELLVVIAIIAVLAAMLLPAVFGYMDGHAEKVSYPAANVLSHWDLQ